MDKKEYIVNQLKRTTHKKYENYCITRIISKLDNLNVKFITQQLFMREGGKIAYADLYFPQLHIYVEIDESYHVDNKDNDRIRKNEIEKKDLEIRKKYNGLEDIITNPIEEFRISATDKDTIEDINKNIDLLVVIIKKRINDLGDSFIPWTNVYEDPSHYIREGLLDGNLNCKFRTIDEIGKLFNLDKIPMGYKIHGYVPIKKDLEYLWCPILKLGIDDEKNSNYENTITNDGMFIYEYFKKENEQEVKKVLNTKIKRFIFAKYKDELGVKAYKFLGIYKLDNDKTKNDGIRTWKRDDKILNLKPYFENDIIYL